MSLLRVQFTFYVLHRHFLSVFYIGVLHLLGTPSRR